jgi:hypothetical protein
MDVTLDGNSEKELLELARENGKEPAQVLRELARPRKLAVPLKLG